MPLIKGDESVRRAAGAMILDLGDLARQGEAIIAEARAEARRLVAEARAERDRLLADAEAVGVARGETRGHEHGRKAGHEEGRLAAFNQYAQRIKSIETGWESALTEFHDRRSRMLEESRADVLRLALAVGERVARRAIDVDERAVERQLAAALDMVLAPKKLVVHICAADARIVADAMPALAAHLSGSPHVEIRPDPELRHGECVITTAGGRVDARLSTQLDRIAVLLMPGDPAPRDPDAPDHPG